MKFYYRFYDYQPGLHQTYIHKDGDTMQLALFYQYLTKIRPELKMKNLRFFLITPDENTNFTTNKLVPLMFNDIIDNAAYIEIWY